MIRKNPDSLVRAEALLALGFLLRIGPEAHVIEHVDVTFCRLLFELSKKVDEDSFFVENAAIDALNYIASIDGNPLEQMPVFPWLLEVLNLTSVRAPSGACKIITTLAKTEKEVSLFEIT